MPATDHNGLAITNPATQDAYLAVQSANITCIKGVEDDDMPTIQNSSQHGATTTHATC